MRGRELSHGFSSGVNNITITKILKWQNSGDIWWKAFLWYIADFATIVDFGENWFKVNIVSDKQLNFFYSKVIQYQSNICENNYEVDIQNELWKDHKIGTERNLKILLKLSE
ncbi:hypothetical protein LGK97_14035 [Clostridium sp. CS001]|uniref:hypothetical protein n=1 Tax=Clostridium sp. CS001 TaxID=2880648 RepID=UPI001CF484B6|nr:hypothetical protein [Clostridium sp. CS001]MCB2290862.1 hypothetical protein [Clostridium sp. CS001]